MTQLVYTTPFGRAYRGDSRDLLSSDLVKPRSVDLIVCSPPFALTRSKDYPNKEPGEYIEWFRSFVPGFRRILSETGSLVVDIGGTYLPGRPERSTYHFELAVALAEDLELCQEFYWYNPAKLPSPAQWVNIDRRRVKDSVNLVLWYAKSAEKAKADNRRVLKRYSESMEKLLKSGYQAGVRPSNHQIGEAFVNDHGGAIPPNLLGFVRETEGSEDELQTIGGDFEMMFPNLIALSNTASNSAYLRRCRDLGVKPHGARFPVQLPGFFIEFLTEEEDLVVDPFAGSNASGKAAEELGRHWIACDLDAEGGEPGDAGYVLSSALRFNTVTLREELESGLEHREWVQDSHVVEPVDEGAS